MALVKNTNYKPLVGLRRTPHFEQLALHAAILALALAVVAAELFG